MLSPEDIDRVTAEGERLEVEFKSERSRQISDAEIVENAVCLANGRGGRLFLGVEDDGTVTGARQRHGAELTDPRRMEAMIGNRTRPSMAVRVEIVRHPQGMVIAIEVPRATVAVATSEGKYLKRVLTGKGTPACEPLFVHEMAVALGPLAGADPTLGAISGATLDDLDPLEFERFRRLARESGGRGDASLLDLPDLELAKTLGGVDANGEVAQVRLLGLLLFGRLEPLRRMVPTHEAAFQDLGGTEVGANDFFRFPLLRLFEDIASRLDHRNRSREVMKGMVRVDVPDYSTPSLREALANALVHRDYTMMGAVHVQWSDDQVRIDSPGGLPEGVRLDNLLVTPPRPRNPMLADAFKRAGLVERTGRGIDKIFEGQLRYGRPAPAYDLSTERSVSVVLPGGPANLEFAKFVVEESSSQGRLEVTDLLVLDELRRQRGTTVRRTAKLIQRNEAEARKVLSRLAERTLIEQRGTARSTEYLLSAHAHSALGEESAHARGFEPFQMEQRVLQYVESNGRITRGQAAELCGITPRQAGQLLSKLKNSGKLRLVARGRNAHYVRSN